MKLLSTEMVFRGHHDKLADQLADGILQHYLRINPEADVNIDVVGGEGTVFVTGNISNSEVLDITRPIKSILRDLGYDTDILIVDNTVQGGKFQHEETSIYGYANNETNVHLPKTMLILQEIAKEYYKLCKKYPEFLPDGKVIMEGTYENNKLIEIKSMNINHQNTGCNIEFTKGTINKLVNDVAGKYNVQIENIEINPYGKYYKGGFDRDTGLTGVKPRIDSYQGYCNSNEFALSGKSIYGLRSGVYKARELAKDLLVEGNYEWCEVKVDYDANCDEPSLITIVTDKGDIKVGNDVYDDFVPVNIVHDLELLDKDFINLSSYGQIQEDVGESL